ncbi:MAG: hypothetical protein GW858_08125 [Sphingomonadales bacterium]|nr:hypothetical protein [Sphingomonadales bacterium]NCQ20475.1 hypothetical protein [Sphingomonadales bacterium]NCT03083.1 hypothetical protein [Sphingomonadales bacterium]
MRGTSFLLMSLMAVGCWDPASHGAGDTALIAQDPVMARALHDPLMSDPDLASRNEANAAIGFPDSSALPVITGNREKAGLARQDMRLELLENGPIPELPPPHDGTSGRALTPLTGPADLLAAVGAPADCAAALRQNFAFAANLSPVAALPPRGMVIQAGGADTARCGLRIIRYHTAAPSEDVLQYHYARALRGGLDARRYNAPEHSMTATGAQGETLVVHLRAAPHGLIGVTLVYRAPEAAPVRAASRP